MNKEEQEYFNKVHAKLPGDLTPNERAYLRARSAYIGKRGQKKFAEVLAEKPKQKKK